MRKIFVLILALIIVMVGSTVAFGDADDITVNVGPGYEVLDVTIEESYDATHGWIETVTFTWAPVESSFDAVAVVIFGVSTVFLAVMTGVRRKIAS